MPATITTTLELDGCFVVYRDGALVGDIEVVRPSMGTTAWHTWAYERTRNPGFTRHPTFDAALAHILG